MVAGRRSGVRRKSFLPEFGLCVDFYFFIDCAWTLQGHLHHSLAFVDWASFWPGLRTDVVRKNRHAHEDRRHLVIHGMRVSETFISVGFWTTFHRAWSWVTSPGARSWTTSPRSGSWKTSPGSGTTSPGAGAWATLTRTIVAGRGMVFLGELFGFHFIIHLITLFLFYFDEITLVLLFCFLGSCKSINVLDFVLKLTHGSLVFFDFLILYVWNSFPNYV